MNIKNNKILIIAPHADDEVLGVGGTVNKLKDSNTVGVVICGARANDNQEHIQSATSHYDYVNQISCVDEHYHENFKYILRCIEHSATEFKPDVVYIPNEFDFNLDHKTVYQACEIAFRRYQTNAPTTIFSYETPSSTTQSFRNNFKCNYYEVLTYEHIESKIKTLELYKNEVRSYPNPRSAEGIMTYAKFRGMECNANYAEAFKLIYQKN